jgi:hypothetical protein
MEGKLMSRAEVERRTAWLYRSMRDACLNLPSRLATQLAAETDEATVRRIFEVELHRIFGDSAERELKSMPTRGEWRLPRR